MEATSTLSAPVDVPARLSSAQKRDLLGQAFAAVVTTALIAAPFLGPSSGSTESPEGPLPAQSFAGAVSVVTVAERANVPRPRPIVRAKRPAAERLMASAVPVTMLQPQAVVASGDLRDLDDTPMRSAPRKPFSRKLTGWLTGDGTHTVRPFPTIPSVRQ